jgi:hypothetical protein
MTRQTSRSYRRPFRPLPVALFNHACNLISPLGLGVTLQEESLVGAARRRSRLHYFGDESFRVPLRILLESIEQEAELHGFGRLMMRQSLIRLLVNRLRVRDALDRHPEIALAELEDPVFIVGLQRTGTTLLHRLLACDPRFRFLASWEALNVAPMPRRYQNARDPRIPAAKVAQHALSFMAPDFFAVHPVDALAPEEDVLLLEYSFLSTVPEATLNVPEYALWLEEQDPLPAYRLHQTLLKYLSWQRPALSAEVDNGQMGRWLLKTPHHLEHLDQLLLTYPRAKIIYTHRDPVRTLASFCSMVSHGRGVFSDAVDPHRVGQQWQRKVHRMVDRAMATRDRVDACGGGETFIDVHYRDLLDDPMAQVRRVYSWLGWELTPDVADVMQGFRDHNPQHKHGEHRYQLADFGLDAGEQRSAFETYTERFAVAREDA